MDFHDETRVGQHTYGVHARSEPAGQDQPATVAVEFTGADSDGRVVAEGNVLINLAAMGDSTAFLGQTLEGLAALQGQRSRTRSGGRSRSTAPARAGQPWSQADCDELRQRWTRSAETASAPDLVGELAKELGRTRSAVRAQLARLSCDPDVPGRTFEATPP